MNKMLANVLIIPSLVFVSLTLWALSNLGRLYTKPTHSYSKIENFECGFDNTSRGLDVLFFKNKIAFCFLILYEVEFLLIIPTAFNSTIISLGDLLVISTTVGVVFYTCLLDSEAGSIEYEM